MKIVVNRCYGGFSLSKFAQTVLNCHSDICRQDPYLISLIESEGSDIVSGSFAKLEIIDIPDECTDYCIMDYDGMELVIYVLDGKLHRV